MDGFLILDKPVGLTSATLLNRVKRFLPRKHKIGHAGTLDLHASGVVVALLGKATKQCERVMGLPKQYEATIRLGATSQTDDADGPIVVRDVVTFPTREALDAATRLFIGEILQTPPQFSALKIDGKRASDRVRAGQSIELKPRTIRIDAIDVLDYAWPDVRVRVDCGRGTYIRSLARDVGAALGVGGYLSALCRTRVGDFTIDRAASLEALEAHGVERFVLPLDGPPALPAKVD
jgi:tRNA pseudouridine55 synthase